MIRSPSLTVGTRPLGLSRRYSASRLPPNGPPTSSRSYSRPSSAQVHSTFCTLDEVVRPQIFSIAAKLHRLMACMEPQFAAKRNPRAGLVYDRTASLICRCCRMKSAFAALSLLLLLPGAALASQQGVIAMKNWKSMDLCAKEAQIAFPDFTPEA